MQAFVIERLLNLWVELMGQLQSSSSFRVKKFSSKNCHEAFIKINNTDKPRLLIDVLGLSKYWVNNNIKIWKFYHKTVTDTKQHKTHKKMFP